MHACEEAVIEGWVCANYTVLNLATNPLCIGVIAYFKCEEFGQL